MLSMERTEEFWVAWKYEIVSGKFTKKNYGTLYV
jgi:hypothetical protein